MLVARASSDLLSIGMTRLTSQLIESQYGYRKHANPIRSNERCLSLSELGAQTRDYARCGWVLSWDSLVGQEHALFGQSECIDL
jgi:hypothetical protein